MENVERDMVDVMDEVAPLSSDGSNGVGVLFVHGFTGSPVSMRPWSDYFSSRGYSVSLPLLPGHGTSPEQMNLTTWQDWYAGAEQAYLELAAKCQTVFICSLSMGGALTLRLANLHKPAGIVLVNPLVHMKGMNRFLIPVVSRFVAMRPAIGNDIKKPGVVEHAYDQTPLKAAASLLKLLDEVQSRISGVSAPVLLLRSVEDHVVPASNSEWILANVASQSKREILLRDSYHVATVDNDAQIIFAESLNFIESLS
ncbi:thermostable monoacylglycerol lipase [mine drainage metagenome]|uniref:Thermostable monoacylglycerol lipase n=1 Tax=mine drainage metagenome TaxID=410659 RepID=A0A1J5QKS7_9ZZZZ